MHIILCKILLLANDQQRFVLLTNIFWIFNNRKITEFKGLYGEKNKHCVKAKTETYKIQKLPYMYCGFPNFN